MKRIALTLAAVCFPAAASAGPVQDRIYPAPKAQLSLAGLPASAEFVTVTTADSLAIKGVAVSAQPGKPTLLVFHGNGSEASGTIAWFAPLLASGYGIVAAEYRGYGGNPGTPGEDGLAADANAFYALARTRAGAGPLIVVGHSLGGGVAFGLAKRQKLDALVTIATFTRLREMTGKMTRAFVPDAYRNEATVPLLDEPWFLVHGLRDDVVPATMGNALHKAATLAQREGASFVLANADHRPSGEQVKTVLDAVVLELTTGRWDGVKLAPDIKLIPFGASVPVNGF